MAKAKLKEEYHIQYTNNKTGALVNKYFSSEYKLKQFLEEYSDKYTFLPQPRRIKNPSTIPWIKAKAVRIRNGKLEILR